MHNFLNHFNFLYCLKYKFIEKKYEIKLHSYSISVGRKIAENIRKIFLIKKPKPVFKGGHIKIYKPEDFFKSADQLVKERKAFKIGNVCYINPRICFKQKRNKYY